MTDKLQNFGYVELTSHKDSMLLKKGESIPAHEFHYSIIDEPYCDCIMRKPKSLKKWVTSEVLPAIRKQGFYSAQKEQDNSLITSEQQYEISSHVMRKTHALFGNRNYSAVYRALKRRFRIPRYTLLAQP